MEQDMSGKTSVADDLIASLRQAVDQGSELRRFDRVQYFYMIDMLVREAKGNIPLQRVVNKKRILRYISNVVAPVLPAVGVYMNPVDPEAAGIERV